MHRPSPNEIAAELAQIAARWEEPVPEVELETLVELKRREQGLGRVQPASREPFPGNATESPARKLPSCRRRQ